MTTKKRALLSVSDKSGIVDFAKSLHTLGFELVSTGGTEKAIKDAGIPVINISDITGFPECLDGRVKTLHPNVHAGILAMRSNPEHVKQIANLNIQPIDIVAINLYPFKETIMKDNVSLEEAIENIDIGGPTMLRSAAKNWQDVAVIVDPADYAKVISELEEGAVTKETKFSLALNVFEHTAAYDALISNYLRKQIPGVEKYPNKLTLTFEKKQDMRYGENPHQSAVFYSDVSKDLSGTLTSAKQLHGKELSYNNINDTDGAINLIKEFDSPCVVAVKHANPCGVGLGSSIFEAWTNAYNADPVSIFGGIIAANREIDLATAEKIGQLFIEIVIAPSFAPDALESLAQKKNIRLLELPDISKPHAKGTYTVKKPAGGLLMQELDTELYNENEFKTVTNRAPTDEEMKQLLFAWKVVKHTKSNAIALVKGNLTIGVGPGQTNRITALELAINYAGEKTQGAVLASDAFFPFSDCVEAAQKAGITAIIQPGGSIKDEDSVAAANAAGIAMVFTGMRHFLH